MHLITSVPTLFDGKISPAMEREIRTGFKMEKATEGKREYQAGIEARELMGTKHPTLGRPVAVMPAREFFRLTAKYGHEEVHSKEFLRDYNKRFPHLSPNNI